MIYSSMPMQPHIAPVGNQTVKWNVSDEVPLRHLWPSEQAGCGKETVPCEVLEQTLKWTLGLILRPMQADLANLPLYISFWSGHPISPIIGSFPNHSYLVSLRRPPRAHYAVVLFIFSPACFCVRQDLVPTKINYFEDWKYPVCLRPYFQ